MQRLPAAVKTVSLRLPKDLADKLDRFSQDRAVTTAQAARIIIEDHFEEEPRRQQTRKSLNRLMEINEYMFATLFEQNRANMTPEKRKELLNDVAESIRRYHPEL
ncbi:MAG: hypothetical protein KGP14_11800 [Betaproteobacteria bacterium]|nr:hypothetical protein [Betaproteobacteria bacterium]